MTLTRQGENWLAQDRLDFADAAKHLTGGPANERALRVVFVPRKLSVRDSECRMQIGNDTSKSEASIQSETALNAGETDNSSTDQLEARHQKEHKDVRYFWDTRTSSRRRLQYQEGKELRKYWKDANHRFSAAMLFKLQDWYSTRPWIPHSSTR